MKLRTAVLLALVGAAASSAAAFTVPVSATPETTRPIALGGDAPGGDEPLGATARFTATGTLTLDGRLGHGALARGGDGETYLFASVAGSDSPARTAAPMHLALVIDRSGSMRGERIANAIAAATGIVERMREGDRVTVVSFDTDATVVVPPTTTSASTRASILAAIRGIRLGGDTCISCGMETAMRVMDDAASGDQVTRMILLSDGAANHGVRDVPGLRALAARMRDRGCAVSTIGVDVDFDEKVMAAIAAESNGRHYFVPDASALPAIFDEELDGILATVASRSELAVDLAPGVEVVEVFDRTFRREGRSRVVVPFGTFAARQEKTVLMRVRVPVDREGAQPVATLSLHYRDLDGRRDEAAQGALVLAVSPPGEPSSELDPFVAARVQRSRTAQTLTEANRLFEQGRVEDAKARLDRQTRDLQTSEKRARAVADELAVPAPKAARPLDADFEEQLAAVATAQSAFAAPPPASPTSAGALGGGGAGAAPKVETREGKAAVRRNQSAASSFGF